MPNKIYFPPNFAPFGEKLREARTNRRLTQKQFADNLNVVLGHSISPGVIYNWEVGHSLPNKQAIIGIIDVLHLTLIEASDLLEASGYAPIDTKELVELYKLLPGNFRKNTHIRLLHRNQHETDMTVERLETDVIPVLRALMILQEVTLQTRGFTFKPTKISSITQQSPIDVSFDIPIVKEVIEAIYYIFEPWRRKKAEDLGQLEVATKETDVELAKSEVLRVQAEVAQQRAEATKSEAEAEKHSADAESLRAKAAIDLQHAEGLRIANERAKLALIREEIEIAREMAKLMVPDADEARQVEIVTKILPAVRTLTSSDLRIELPPLEDTSGYSELPPHRLPEHVNQDSQSQDTSQASNDPNEKPNPPKPDYGSFERKRGRRLNSNKDPNIQAPPLDVPDRARRGRRLDEDLDIRFELPELARISSRGEVDRDLGNDLDANFEPSESARVSNRGEDDRDLGNDLNTDFELPASDRGEDVRELDNEVDNEESE